MNLGLGDTGTHTHQNSMRLMGLVRFGVFGCKCPISQACLDLGFCDDGVRMQMHFGF